MSDFAIFWMALIGSTAYHASARTYRGGDRFNLVIRMLDGLVSFGFLVVAIVFFVRASA